MIIVHDESTIRREYRKGKDDSGQMGDDEGIRPVRAWRPAAIARGLVARPNPAIDLSNDDGLDINVAFLWLMQYSVPHPTLLMPSENHPNRWRPESPIRPIPIKITR